PGHRAHGVLGGPGRGAAPDRRRDRKDPVGAALAPRPVGAAMAAPTGEQGYHGCMGKHRDPCTDPQHHVHDAEGFVAAVERASRERGLRLTPIRARVLELIAEEGRPIKAYDLLE